MKYLSIEAVVEMNDDQIDIEQAKTDMLDVITAAIDDSGMITGNAEYAVGEVEGPLPRDKQWIK